MTSALPGLLHAVRTGRSAYEHVHGRTFWEAPGADEVLGTSFDQQRAGWARQWLPGVVGLDLWRDVGRVLDVGGGRGELVAALEEAHPHPALALVELDATADRAAEALRDRRLAERVELCRRSSFDPLPTGADATSRSCWTGPARA